MSAADKTNFETLQTPNAQKFQGLFGLIGIVVVGFSGLWLSVRDLFTNLDNFIARYAYVAFNPWDIPTILASPILFLLIYGIVLRLIDRATERKIQNLIKFALVFVVLFFLSRIIYGFIGPQYLQNKGYSSCWSLSSPSIMSSTVYVKRPEYCLDNVGNVRKELMRWMDQHSAPNKALDLAALKRETTRLLTNLDG